MKKFIIYAILILLVIILIFISFRYYYYQNNKITKYENNAVAQFYAPKHHVIREIKDNDVYMGVVLPLKKIYSLNPTKEIAWDAEILELVFMYNNEKKEIKNPQLIVGSGDILENFKKYDLIGDLQLNDEFLSNISFESEKLNDIKYEILISEIKLDKIKNVTNLHEYWN